MTDRERLATLEGKVRETRLGNKLGFKDTRAEKGFRAPTDAEHIARDAIREACGTVYADHYKSGEIAAKIIVWEDGETEIRYFSSEGAETGDTSDTGSDENE